MATSKFVKYFQTNDGRPLIGASVWLVPMSNYYPTGAIQLTAHSTRQGVYYHAGVEDGEYRVYIDPAGGTSAVLYDENIYFAENALTTVRKKFDELGVLQFAYIPISDIISALPIVSTSVNGFLSHSDYVLLQALFSAKTAIDAAIAASHGHTNKALLDTYTQTNADLAAAIAAIHGHTNKALLDTYSQTNSDLAAAIAAIHSHTNKAILDLFTSVYKASLDATISASHGHNDLTKLNAMNALLNSSGQLPTAGIQDGAISGVKTSFISKGKNLINYNYSNSLGQNGQNLKLYTSGGYSTASGYWSTDFIPVTAQSYMLTNPVSPYFDVTIPTYDSNFVCNGYILRRPYGNNPCAFTVPSVGSVTATAVAYIRITLTNVDGGNWAAIAAGAQLEVGSVATAFESYGYFIDTDNGVPVISKRVYNTPDTTTIGLDSNKKLTVLDGGLTLKKLAAVQTGKNLLDYGSMKTNVKVFNDSGSESTVAGSLSTGFIKITGGVPMTLNTPGISFVTTLCFFDANKNYLGLSAGLGYIIRTVSPGAFTFTPNASAVYMRMLLTTQATDWNIIASRAQLEYGTQATAYEPNCNYLGAESGVYTKVLAPVATKLTAPTLLLPPKIYCVGNDIPVPNWPGFPAYLNAYQLSNNLHARLYADHCLLSATGSLISGLDWKFASTGRDYTRIITPRIDDTHWNDSSNTVVKKTTITDTISGNDVADTAVSLTRVSVLANNNQTKFPKLLCLGDSITNGTVDVFGNSVESSAYWSVVKELFEREKIDNGDDSSKFRMLAVGTNRRVRSFSYKNVNGRSLTSASEGWSSWAALDLLYHPEIRFPSQGAWDLLGLSGSSGGTTWTGDAAQRDIFATTADDANSPRLTSAAWEYLWAYHPAQMLSAYGSYVAWGALTAQQNAITSVLATQRANPTNKFYDNSLTGKKFSLAKYLERYRTLLDDGVTAATSGTSPAIGTMAMASTEVCKPTHVLICHGANDLIRASVTSWLTNVKALADIIQAYDSSIFVAFGLSDYAGGILSSLYPELPAAITGITNMGSSHDNHYNAMSALIGYLYPSGVDNEDSLKRWLLPFYWVQPTYYSIPMYEAPAPEHLFVTHQQPRDYHVVINPDNNGNANTLHPSAFAHANWAYQLYGWLKYTNTLS